MQEMKDVQQQEIDRAREVYGDKFIIDNSANRVSDESIVILTPDEMDNDEFINFLEKNPTYNRNSNDIKKVRKPAKVAVIKDEPKDTAEKTDPDESELIGFEF